MISIKPVQPLLLIASKKMSTSQIFVISYICKNKYPLQSKILLFSDVLCHIGLSSRVNKYKRGRHSIDSENKNFCRHESHCIKNKLLKQHATTSAGNTTYVRLSMLSQTFQYFK